jgi:hypothetical protein
VGLAYRNLFPPCTAVGTLILFRFVTTSTENQINLIRKNNEPVPTCAALDRRCETALVRMRALRNALDVVGETDSPQAARDGLSALFDATVEDYDRAAFLRDRLYPVAAHA